MTGPSEVPSGQEHTSYQPSSERLSEADYQSTAADYLIYCCHLATYGFAEPLVAGRTTLDFGCGTGYGSHRLAKACSQVTGVDISAEAIRFARSQYHAPNLRFEQIDPLPAHRAPFDDGAFEAITSFQVIEHIWEVDAYVDELHRLLSPGGIAVIATPDRSTRLRPRQRPWNRYHVVEYDDEGLRSVLARRFDDVDLRYMTAPGVDEIEMARSKRLRDLTLPFTFPAAPEWWRRSGLGALKRLQALRPARPARPAESFGFGVSDVRIDATPVPAMNLVAVVRR